MSTLKAFINEMLKLDATIAEGKLEGVTTQTSRSLINFVKKVMQDPEAAPENMRDKNYWLVKLDPLPKVSIFFTFILTPPDKPQAMWDAHHEKTWDGTELIEMTLALPDTILATPGDWKKYMGAANMVIRGVVRHELEHVSQSQKGEIPATVIDPRNSWGYASELDRFDEYMEYLEQRHEVEAKTMELYKKAKYRRKPLSFAMAGAVKFIRDAFPTLDDAMVAPRLQMLRSKWTRYAIQRLPDARWE